MRNLLVLISICLLTACMGRFSKPQNPKAFDSKESEYMSHLPTCSSQKDIIICDWGSEDSEHSNAIAGTSAPKKANEAEETHL